MGFLRDRFLYRDDYFPALQGLRGLAVLWFFHWSFYAQFDSAKVARLMDGRPWMEGVIGAAVKLLSPAATVAPLAMCVLGGFLAELSAGKASNKGVGNDSIVAAGPRLALTMGLSRLERFYPVFLVSVLPILAYTGCDLAGLVRAMTAFILPGDSLAGNMTLLSHSFWLPFLWAVLRAATQRSLGFAFPAGGFLAAAGIDYLIFGDVRTTVAFMAVLFGAWDARLTAGRPVIALGAKGINALNAPSIPPDGFDAAGQSTHSVSPASRCPNLRAGGVLVFAAFVPLAVSAQRPATVLILGLMISSIIAIASRSLCVNPGYFTARLLSHPLLRSFGAVALPFYLIHTTWGFRLSRAILQTELRSPAAIAAHWAISLGLSALAAGFLHVFFERPRFLRNAPSADKHPSSATQGASP